MNHLVPAQAGAQLITLVIYSVLAAWYVAPWLRRQTRADALIALLWIHVFRYVALQIFSAQKNGFPISDGGAMDIVLADVGGAALAFLAILLLRVRLGLGILFSWLLVAETAYDTVDNILGGIHEHLMGAASGVTWIILVFFVPAIVVSVVLAAWQLLSRRAEVLQSERPGAQNVLNTSNIT